MLVLQLAFFLLIHFTETEHSFVFIERFIVQEANAYPPVAVLKASSEVAAVILNLLGNEMVDIGERKAFNKFLIGVFLDHSAHDLQKVAVASLFRNLGTDIFRTLDHIINVIFKVHTVDCVEGISKNLNRLVDPFHFAAEQTAVHPHEEHQGKAEIE